ncbi:Rv3654c family TadE-like protein [Bifidobacterium simiiventris]|nr:Rv3654c family TadE-like protein [Bifidobacterium simiiventris]
MNRADCGSGTMAGVALIMLVGVLLGVVALAGNLLICQTRARTVADLAAISAALTLYDGGDDACATAQAVAAANDAGLDSCAVDGEDVQIALAVATQVPFAPSVTYRSRAGPVECG